MVIVIVVVIGISLIGRYLHPNYSDNCMNNVKAFHKLPENSLDLIVYGSSHAWRGCDTQKINDEYGISAFDYGANWQRINTTYMYMQDSFRTQKPKAVFVECYKVSVITEDEDLTGEIYYSKAVPWFKGKADYLRRCFAVNPERWATYFCPFIMFHGNWTTWFDSEESNNTEDRNVDFYSNSRGYDRSSDVKSAELSSWTTFDQKELGEENLEILEDIVKLCNEHGAELVLFTVPFQGKFEYHDALTEFASQNGCIYIDCFEHIDEVGIDPETDFRDATHLNESGAGKIADYLMNNSAVQAALCGGTDGDH